MRLGESFERLRAQSDQTLLACIRVDLDLGFTLLDIAKTELEMGDFEGFEQAIQKVRSVVQTVEDFKARLRQENKPEIEERLSGLRRLAATLTENRRPRDGRPKT